MSNVLFVHEQKVAGYLPADGGVKTAFKDADVIVIPAGVPRTLLSRTQIGFHNHPFVPPC